MKKIFKRIISLILCLLMVSSNGVFYLAYAAEDLYGDWLMPVVQINNGVIRVTSDKQTGRFITETLSGLPNKGADDYKDLLYGNRFESPETSYTSVRINGEDYIYGNDYGYLGLEGHYTAQPYADLETNTIISEWSIDDVVVVQRLSLPTNPKLASIGSVHVTYDIVNKGSDTKTVGLRMLLDTKIGAVDSPALTVPGDGFIYKEKEYNKEEIPSLWYAYEQYLTPQIIALGAVSGEGLSKPDKLQFAAWADVSQTKWDYSIDPDKSIIDVKVNGVPYDGSNGTYPPDGSVVDYAAKDSCAVMYWEPVSLSKGEAKSIDTAYGVGDASVKDNDPGYRISLQGTDKLNMNNEKTGYTTEYVNAEFNIDNNFDASKNIENLQIELELPDELKLIEGEQKTVIREFKAGTYHRSMWEIEPVVQDKFTISAYSVLLRAEGMPAQRITKVLIMEGIEGGMPSITFLDSTPKTPFYIEDTNRSVFINGSGFDSFGSAIGQVMEAKLIQGNKVYTLDWNTFRKVSDTVISLGIPDNIALGTYDLFVSVADATNNKNDEKTFVKSVEISNDIKYSLNLVSQITLPIVMKDDGYNTPVESITVYGKFIDNDNGTYTSLGATVDNPVRINNSLKFANGTLTINTNQEDASIQATDGVLWCDVVDQRTKTQVQAVVAQAGFKFVETSYIGDNDTFVRMIYDATEGGSTYDVAYQNVPISLESVTITSDGIEIKGSMGILNPLTYGTNGFTPSSNVNDGINKALGSLALGYYEAEVDNITVDQTGMDIEGKFAFQMPFVMSLFAGTNAVLEINTKQEHIVVEVAVSLGEMMEESAGAKARIGFRKGRFDEIYVGADFPVPYTVAPPIPIGISGFSGGLKNLSFAGAFPITIIMGIAIEDSTGIEFMGYNLLSAEGEIELSAFHLEGEAEADLYMMDLAEVAAKFVWATWDPDIEKRGIKIDATIHYKIFKGNIYIQYLEGESFLGRGTLAIAVPGAVPIIGGLELAGVIAEITEYSIAGSVFVLDLDVGVRYYFATGKTEFLELKEELEKSGNGIIVEYDDYCIAQYGYNYIPIEYTQFADENSKYVTELNLTNNSNVMLVLRMTKEKFDNLNDGDDNIKLVKPGTGGVLSIKYVNNSELFNADGTTKDIAIEENEIIAVKQLIDKTADGFPNEYMVTIPIATPADGQWTVVTNGSMEVLPYSAMKNPEITNFNASNNNINSTITAQWQLDGEPDKFRFYIVNAKEVSDEEYNNPPSLWGKGSLLYGQTTSTKDYYDEATKKIIQIEDQVIYTAPTQDGEPGTFTTDSLNLPTGNYYIYAKADKENTVADYKVCKIEVTNPKTPDAPSSLEIKDIGNNQISISWDADYNMNGYYIYRKETLNETSDLGAPMVVYKVYDPEDYSPLFENWPGNLPKERMDRFEVIIDGDELDAVNPTAKTYYFEIRAVGTKSKVIVNDLPLGSESLIPNVSTSTGTIGVPSTVSVTVGVPEEITVYTEIKSADSKIVQQAYVEKDIDGIEQRYYKYVTSSPNVIIAGNSNTSVKYRIQREVETLATSEDYTTRFNENITLKEGINYFIITYENERGDILVEEYVVEYDNKAPTLVILEPKEGAVAQDGKITVTGVTDPYSIVTINNVNYDADMDGKFSVELDFGTSYSSIINFEVRDAANNVTTKTINILNDLAEIKDVTLVPEYKIMTTETKQQFSTYISSDDVLGEKLNNNSVKYSIMQGGQYASITDSGYFTAKYQGTVIVKSEFFVTDNVSISDSIAIDISGTKKPSSKYYPPVYSKELLTWLAGSEMSTKGGTIKTDDGVILFIPEGALPYYQDNIDIFAFKDIQSLLSEMNIPLTASSVSNPYYISLVTEFVKPAKLTLPVTGGSAYVYYYDKDIKALIYKGGEMSRDGKTVTADITKPGVYIALSNPVQNIFADIPSNYWGYDYVYGLNYLNIISGYNNDGIISFNPDGKITRAEFIKLLVMAQNLSLSEASGLDLKFADNNKIPEWAELYIKAASMNGLVNGKNIDNKNYISCGDYITREEIASIIGRSIDSDKISDRIFTDKGKISSWAQAEIQKLVELGIISGYEDDSFKPKDNASRTEAAVMIYKYLSFIN